ncbi:MAG: hypothetical protein FJ387_01205 [Verrucomicrobia bacterium]|nr:hypothetical protein [Verrucomicrobiota bacterium]
MTRGFALVVVEGALEVPASLKLLAAAGARTEGVQPIDKGGRVRFWQDAPRYNRAAAKLGPVLGLADLEAFPCPSGLLAKHLRPSRHPGFVLRIAERMLESWFLADDSLADFLRISGALLPRSPDTETNPKQTLVNLARRSRSVRLRDDLVPVQGSSGIVGKGYTPRMTEFIECHWRPSRAQQRSESLRRALAAIRLATVP